VPVQYSYTSSPPMCRRPVQSLSACTVQLLPLLPNGPYGLYSTAIPLLLLWDVKPVQSLSACPVQLHLYSPYGPYGLYSASVPVQYSYTSTPPMCRRPVQSLSACTWLHIIRCQKNLQFAKQLGTFRRDVLTQFTRKTTRILSSGYFCTRLSLEL
jgi:hypothetical protein